MTVTTRRVFQTDTDFAHYEVLDMNYEGRSARVLYSGQRKAAQSGIPTDDLPEMLFDYNQRLWELVSHLQPKRLLVIGGGVYTLPSRLLEVRPKVKLDVVEIDAGLDQIATDYFNFKPSRRLKIFHQDGRAFLEQSNEQYDLIIMDAYTNFAIPELLTEAKTVELLLSHLKPEGVVASNVIAAYHGKRSGVLHRLTELYEARFTQVDIFPASHGLSLWIPQNFILVAQQSPRLLDAALRYAPLDNMQPPFDVARDLGA